MRPTVEIFRSRPGHHRLRAIDAFHWWDDERGEHGYTIKLGPLSMAIGVIGWFR